MNPGGLKSFFWGPLLQELLTLRRRAPPCMRRDKRGNCEQQTSTPIPDPSSFVCTNYGRDYHSRVGLHSHGRRCKKTDDFSGTMHCQHWQMVLTDNPVVDVSGKRKSWPWYPLAIPDPQQYSPLSDIAPYLIYPLICHWTDSRWVSG